MLINNKEGGFGEEEDEKSNLWITCKMNQRRL